MEVERFHIYHAPWSRKFKTFFVKGAFAFETQIGPVVVQWFYQSRPPYSKLMKYTRHLHIWRDPYWR